MTTKPYDQDKRAHALQRISDRLWTDALPGSRLCVKQHIPRVVESNEQQLEAQPGEGKGNPKINVVPKA